MEKNPSHHKFLIGSQKSPFPEGEVYNYNKILQPVTTSLPIGTGAQKRRIGKDVYDFVIQKVYSHHTKMRWSVTARRVASLQAPHE